MDRSRRFGAPLLGAVLGALLAPLSIAEASVAPLLAGVGLFGSYAPPPPGAVAPDRYTRGYLTFSFDLNNGSNTARNEFPDFKPHYKEVQGYPLEHTQHTARLPHRDRYGNHGYFVGTQSNSGGGWVWIAKSYDGVFDRQRDPSMVTPDPAKYRDGYAGKVIWYTKTDASHPAGGCNHPGNITVHNNAVLAVACQDWPGNTSIPFGLGDMDLVGSTDHVLFYSVANPDYPVYLGHWRVDEPFLEMANNTLQSVSLMESGGFTHVVVGSAASQKHFRTSKHFLPGAARDELASVGDGAGHWTSGGLNVYRDSGVGTALTWWRNYTERRFFFGDQCEQEFRFTNVQYENGAGHRTNDLAGDSVRLVVSGASSTGDDIAPNPIHSRPCNGDLYPSESKWCASTHAMWTGPDGTPVHLCADHAMDDAAELGFYFRYYPMKP